jgi:DNA-binding transcriptional ArsR family regulator
MSMKQGGRSAGRRRVGARGPDPAEARGIDETAELMKLAGNSTRLKLLYLLDSMKELSVSDLADLLQVSVSAVSQHLAKLRARGLVNSRRDAQTIYYRLGESDFIGKLRAEFFEVWAN